MKTIYLILKEDIVYFPPILTIINILCDLGYGVVHLGTYSDDQGRELLEKKGAKFVSMPSYNGNSNPLSKLISQLKFRRGILRYLSSVKIDSDDRVWLAQIETIYLLHKLVNRYPVIIHPLEYADAKVKWSYKLISPSLNLTKTFQKAKKVVCCEYNRAHIAKGLFSLEELPIVLPNKPYDNGYFDSSITPPEVSSIINEYRDKTRGKKVILYQGIFLDKERRLEEFCQAISLLPDDYILVAMGGGSEMFERLREKYEGNRILFIPFITPPHHLLVTRDAYIGVLSYFPRPQSMASVLNPLYCAPNKIFEYARFCKPMIANDIPGLHYIFQEYNCGICINYPMTPEAIEDAIIQLDENYSNCSNGAFNFYNSVNLHTLINRIVQ